MIFITIIIIIIIIIMLNIQAVYLSSFHNVIIITNYTCKYEILFFVTRITTRFEFNKAH
jgi:hypothetical protein